jgi:hypothetical protein
MTNGPEQPIGTGQLGESGVKFFWVSTDFCANESGANDVNALFLVKASEFVICAFVIL